MRRGCCLAHSHDGVSLAVEVVDDLHVERPVRGEQHLAAGVLDEPHLRVLCVCVGRAGDQRNRDEKEKPGGAEQGRSEQSRAGQSRAEQSTAE